MAVKMWVIIVVLFCAFLAGVGALFFKLASETVGTSIASWITNWKLILGAALYGISGLIFIAMLKHGNLSILYPLIATTYIWVTVLSTYVLKESFPATKWLGIALIILGVAVIVR